MHPMNLKFYGLKEEPFHITPDPDFLYPSLTHNEALALMVQGVEQRKGFVVLTGEAGVGKTIIVRVFLEHCRQQQIKTIYVLNSRVTFGVLMNMIFAELGLEGHSDDVAELLDDVLPFLLEEQKQKRDVVLVVDEAQNMSINTLEELARLLNLETSQGKLLQIFLIGHSELEAKLKLQELKQIQRRIEARVKIAELTPEESLSYIRYRLVKAGLQGKEKTIFTPAALRLIVKHSMGIPRKINIICDNALVSGSELGKKPVPLKVVKGVIADLEGKPSRVSVKWVMTCASLAILFLVIAGLIMIRITEFPRMKNSKLSPGFNAGSQGGVVHPDGAASSVNTPVSHDVKIDPQPTSSFAPASESQPSSVAPAAGLPKTLGGVATERDSLPMVVPKPVDTTDQKTVKARQGEEASDPPADLKRKNQGPPQRKIPLILIS